MKKGGKAKKKQIFKKVVSEQFYISPKKGGGTIKIDVWENHHGEVVKYSLAYINHMIFSGDNGRVLGYDNTHDHHHRHCMGEISELDDFTSYLDIVQRFENEIKDYIR